MPIRHHDWIAHPAGRTPDKVALIDLSSERRFTYAQFDARISRLATHLRDPKLTLRKNFSVASATDLAGAAAS